jgi:hypothetical protein
MTKFATGAVFKAPLLVLLPHEIITYSSEIAAIMRGTAIAYLLDELRK